MGGVTRVEDWAIIVKNRKAGGDTKGEGVFVICVFWLKEFFSQEDVEI